MIIIPQNKQPQHLNIGEIIAYYVHKGELNHFGPNTLNVFLMYCKFLSVVKPCLIKISFKASLFNVFKIDVLGVV